MRIHDKYDDMITQVLCEEIRSLKKRVQELETHGTLMARDLQASEAAGGPPGRGGGAVWREWLSLVGQSL